ncbi:hypothetical protein AB1286_13560 [Trinickia sp. NRRL B-1857]|uniref:hypothetical protein n=1 Tax=Trinickia sp. NRRL B-1857 TaxID=3162879 RepID=UPI003D2E0F49
MSEINGVPTGATDGSHELETPQTTNLPTSQAPTSSTRPQSHPLSNVLSSRGSAQVSANASGTVRRGTGVPLSNTLAVPQRHAPSMSTTPGIQTQSDGEIRVAVESFMASIGEEAPIDATDPTQNLQQHFHRVNATMQGVRQVFEAAARASSSSSDRIEILQDVPDTEEIQNARAHLSEKSRVAEDLHAQAGTKRTNAEELKGAASEANEQARVAAERTDVAQREVAACESRFNDADSAARGADRLASQKETAATDAEADAGAARKQAQVKGDEAKQADEAATVAQLAATRKEGEADGAESHADEAQQNATAKARAADDARDEAKTLRADADGLAQAEAKASEKDKPAAQLAARQAQERASKAETAAQEAKAAAEAAAKQAQTFKADAQTQRAEAEDLRAKANAAGDHARTANEAAGSAKTSADALEKTASSIRGEATAARAQAQKLAQDVVPLRAALNAAKGKAQDAVTKQGEAQNKARTANEDATRAELEASQAEDALRIARSEEHEAGVALRDVIARTPVPTTEETRIDVHDGSESVHNAIEQSGGDDTPGTVIGAETRGTPVSGTQRSSLETWGRNVLKTGGQQFVAVALTTALREAVGAGVEALLTATHASPEAKTAIAGSLYGAVILANVMSMLYQHQQGVATPMTYGGGALNVVALTAAVATAASTGTLKDLVPSLVKTFAYSGGRDTVNLLMPLSDNAPKDKANPLAVQAVDSMFYAANQMLVNSIQSFTGLSGAGLVDAMHNNSTDPNTKEAVTLHSGFASLASYVTANFAGEFADQFTNRVLNNAMSGGKLADLDISLGPIGWPGGGKALETFATEGVPRTSIFYSVYGLTAGADPAIKPSHLGETGASWMQNFVGGGLIALLCLPAVMFLMKGKREGSRTSSNRGSGDVERGGDTPFTALTTPTNAASNENAAPVPLRTLSRANRGNGRESTGDAV